MAQSDRPRGRPSKDADLRPARIVVADDNRLSRELLLAAILRGAGHTVDVVDDGQEAVDRVSQGGVNLVLLDVVMPRLSGPRGLPPAGHNRPTPSSRCSSSP